MLDVLFFPMLSSPAMLDLASALVSTPIFCSMVARTIEPRSHCRQSRQSKEMDSENAATSAPGPLANRPLRETGDFFFIKAGANLRRIAGKVTRGIGCQGVSLLALAFEGI